MYSDDSTDNDNENHNYKSKSIFISLIPIFVMCTYIIGFMVANLFLRKQVEYIKNHLILAFVVSLFSLHPTLTKFLFGLFNCIELDTGEYWLRNDLSISCWSNQHLKIALIVGLPAIFVWIILLPLLLLYLLKRNQNNLD